MKRDAVRFNWQMEEYEQLGQRLGALQKQGWGWLEEPLRREEPDGSRLVGWRVTMTREGERLVGEAATLLEARQQAWGRIAARGLDPVVCDVILREHFERLGPEEFRARLQKVCPELFPSDLNPA